MSKTKIPATFILAALLSAGASGPAAAAPPTPGAGKIVEAIKADAAQLARDINAHNAIKAASHDAPDVVVMASGEPNLTGRSADAAGFKKSMASDPTWKVALINETVDVAASGDVAVYRSTYRESGTRAARPNTHNINFLAGYRRQVDGPWKIAWYIVSPTGPSRPAAAAKKN
jgi:ketosteroid isomerase-like protein